MSLRSIIIPKILIFWGGLHNTKGKGGGGGEGGEGGGGGGGGGERQRGQKDIITKLDKNIVYLLTTFWYQIIWQTSYISR